MGRPRKTQPKKKTAQISDEPEYVCHEEAQPVVNAEDGANEDGSNEEQNEDMLNEDEHNET